MKLINKIKLKGWLLLPLVSVFVFVACDSNAFENGSNDIIETDEANSYTDTSDSELNEDEVDDATIVAGSQMTYIILPPPEVDGDMSVENALANRRSQRDFQNRALSIEQLSQILWAAYGITLPMPDNERSRGGLRTTPSAGAVFPLEIYVIIGYVDEIEPGVYRYLSEEHKIVQVLYGDLRNELSEAALGQRMVREAPISIFYSAIFDRMISVYGERGIKYTYMEIGHSAQNVYLQAVALGLGTCAIGAFTDNLVRQVLDLPDEEEPLYLMPVGYYY